MKAVLVVDVDDDMIGEVDYTVMSKKEMVNGRAELRQLPEKDEEPEDDLTDYVQQDYDRMASYFYGLINGRNNVINEILGETECTTQKKDTSM